MTGHEPDGRDRQRDDNALRGRLTGLDPTRPGGPAHAPDPTAAHVEELIMATTQNPTTSSGTDDQLVPDEHRSGPGRWLAAAAALVLVAAGVAGALSLRGADHPAPTVLPVALTAPGGAGPVSGSCIQFDVQFLRDMPVAFAGTVTGVTDEQVTLSVDRWYNGSAAQQRAEVVTVAQPGGNTSVALDGVEFTRGTQYLVAATDGTVNGCGFSGPADPQLTAAYQQAFGG
ncbi:MAG: hypothetical protein ABI807_04230 [Sporichthyaceae bacterium]